MSERMGMFMFIFGLFLTMAGVGGIEQSVTDAAMCDGLLVCVIGCGIMWCGVLGISVAQVTQDDLYPWQK
jgi:hypothetical protein